jgi:hypothetical protein
VPARESALESASASYGKAMGYAPLLDVLRGYFRIEARDEAGVVHLPSAAAPRLS